MTLRETGISDGQEQLTVASTLWRRQRGNGIFASLLTLAVALLGGAVIIALAGSNPFSTYHAIFTGSGLNWFLPWVGGEDRLFAGQNLQQTLLLAAPLTLVGLAVALAFRAGLFNIGGQGQYLAGAITAVWIGSSLPNLSPALHILLAVLGACAAGALWAGIAGFLRARAGANEVISTIMLNWIAVWVGVFLFGLGGPLQNADEPSIPVSGTVVEAARLPVFWGDHELQGLHVGVFLAIVAVLFFWFFLSRTARGFEIRAVGLNPEAAAYGGIHVGRSYIRVFAICGLFAGLAGALDVLGWQFQLATNDVQTSAIGFLGIAVALVGRNQPAGVLISGIMFAALVNGTSIRNLDPNVFAPELASNLTLILQGAIVLWISAPSLMTLVRKRFSSSSAVAVTAEGKG